MLYTEAILHRVSCRSYRGDTLSDSEIAQLNKCIAQCSSAGGVRFTLVTDRPAPFAGIKSRGLLTGARHFVAAIGENSDPDAAEKCGYYGEQIVLCATAMGLGTCWVGGTYDKDACLDLIREGETLYCVILVGYTTDTHGMRDTLIRSVIHRKCKSVGELADGLAGAPDWFHAGITAVQRAPSACNRQAVKFTFHNGTVTACATMEHNFRLLDLGIAKYHFEVGAHGGTWEWGENGRFVKAAEEKSCGAVIWRRTAQGHEYLLAQHNGGHWSFPKGHVENDETEVETAMREIREETGLTAAIDTGFRQVVTYYPKPNVIKDVVFFAASPTGGAQQAQEEEIAQLDWFTFEEAEARVTFATDVEVLKSAEAYIRRKG